MYRAARASAEFDHPFSSLTLLGPCFQGHPKPVSTVSNGTNATVIENFYTGQVTIRLNPPVTAQYIKIINIGPAANTSWWSIAEFRAFDDKNKSLGTTNWVASASTSVIDGPPQNALDGNMTSRWATGESQRPGNVTLYTTFRSAVANASDLFVLNYMTFNGQGISTTPHEKGVPPPVSTTY